MQQVNNAINPGVHDQLALASEHTDTKGYKQTEIGIIPSDWEVADLSSVATIQSCIAKNSKNLVQDPIEVHYLRVANVQDGFLDLSDVSRIAISRYDLKRFSVLPGDVLMNEGGDMDKLGRGAVWSGDFDPCVHQNHVFVVRCSSRIDPHFLNFWSSGAIARRFFLLTGKQTTNLASISKSGLSLLPVAIPPKREQRAITNALLETDALIDSLEKLIAKKQAIKTATMQQLLTGKTRLPQFARHPEGRSKGTKQSELGEIPEDWSVVRLGEISSFLKGNGLPKSDLTEGGKYKCVHYGQLFTTYGEEINSVLSTTDKRNNPILSQCNDVLMPTSDVTPNGLATASCIQEDDVILGGDIMIIRPEKDLLNGVFLAYAVRSSRGKVMQLVTGSTVYHLYGRDMANFTFALPSLEEQRQVIDILANMNTEILTLRQRLAKTRQIKQGMMQQLLIGKIRLVQPEAAPA